MADETQRPGNAPTTRRVVTGHDATGKAIVLRDGPAPNVKFRESAGLFSTLLWVTRETPASNLGDADASDTIIGTPPPPNGSILRVVDFPPVALQPKATDNAAVLAEMGIKSASKTADRSPYMHRTKSIDYAIVLEGEIVMLLDDSEVTVSAGDILVQRGTNHAWVNRSDEWCRICFVLIDAEPLAGLDDH